MTTSSRRRVPGVTAFAVLLALLLGAPALAQPTNPRAVQNHTAEITLMATADVHGRVLNVDYLNDRPFTPARGFSRLSSLVNEVRAEKGAEQTLLLDIGDSIQGTVLGAYYARREPTADGVPNPVATAMNAIGYDAMVVGNHEFNFGLPHLYAFRDQLDAPLLGANVLEAGTDRPAFEPYVIETVNLRGHKPIKVGVLGLTTPGSALWDRTHVEGQLDFVDGLETAKAYVPRLRAAGADVVVAAIHAGMGSGSSYGDLLPHPENFGRAVAEQVPGIDVVLPAHSHTRIDEQFVTNQQTGERVLVTQPGSHGQHLSVADLQLRMVRGQWTVVSKRAETRAADTVADDPAIVDLVAEQHQRVVDYVNAPIGTSLERLSMEAADYLDVPIMDLINTVQAEAVEAGIAGTAWADLPVLSITAPLARSAAIPQGNVSVRDVAAVYVYENTLRGVVLDGQQVADYLESSAAYFRQVDSSGPHRRAQVAGTVPTYCYDVIDGVSYDIDLSRPVGQRITNLTFDGEPIDPQAEFVLAINNYRHGGGCGHPHVTDAPIAFFGNPDVQDLLIEWIQSRDVVDPADFASIDWRLVHQGTPVTVVP
ncbi:bifunctional metallophosphatase/5'-nucleotidase [Egicoccus halophilus]|uniref:Multifunctional 2',3'-cyclic-nucleotide 2'-phosphodiesterase/5'-nucleotidase/3'-nucleotidase n=1 Tax=Egicoccus halophilus TaxID=1670830 RepID=A0A8J3A728_9ACTN|nr:5'-nucleotidase C-terminal domain-containing protein [Egicoccus halophilus]GGI03301.1 multifunctional 2',3'-cyclic-nucleotide 2'-phosphodiesterase/5'-nucleotidase/3'-nucleotidase [Egicoccus halophilus]